MHLNSFLPQPLHARYFLGSIQFVYQCSTTISYLCTCSCVQDERNNESYSISKSDWIRNKDHLTRRVQVLPRKSVSEPCPQKREIVACMTVRPLINLVGRVATPLMTYHISNHAYCVSSTKTCQSHRQACRKVHESTVDIVLARDQPSASSAYHT